LWRAATRSPSRPGAQRPPARRTDRRARFRLPPSTLEIRHEVSARAHPHAVHPGLRLARPRHDRPAVALPLPARDQPSDADAGLTDSPLSVFRILDTVRMPRLGASRSLLSLRSEPCRLLGRRGGKTVTRSFPRRAFVWKSVSALVVALVLLGTAGA